MRKMYILLTYMIICVSVLNAQNISKVEIRFVNYNILTPFNIKCADFDKAFGDKIKVIYIENKKDLRIFSDLYKSLEYDSSKYYPDVRVKIKVFFDKEIANICMDKRGVLVNDKPHILSSEFYNFVERMKKKTSTNRSKL